MTSPPWFRFYSEALDDLKLARAAQQTEQPKVVILGVWVGLLALANGSPKRGQLLLCDDIPLTLSEMAQKIGIDRQAMEDIIDIFIPLRMVHWEPTEYDDVVLVITNMHKRQFSSDISTSRVREWRKRQKGEENSENETPEYNDNETLQERYCNRPDTDTEQIQNRTDTDNIPASRGATAPQTPPEAPAPASKPSRKAKPEPLTPGAQEFLRLFSAKRFSNAAQRDAVLELEHLYPENFCACAKWAAEKGVARGQAISMMRTALPTWGQKKKIKRGGDGRPPPDEPAGFAGLREVAEKHGIEIDGLTR